MSQKLDTSAAPIILLSESDRIIESLAFGPDGNLLAAGMANGSVIVWDTQSLETVSVIRGKNPTVSENAGANQKHGKSINPSLARWR
ncbi:MAG: hypothetical protein P8M30_12485 [Planctomycetaceae bacterium]|nr:hypothetical protein [Planctomycetaceae bacterium]MDG2390126.1 hypothetical protein [Planctomycetaceae bacterium]